MGKVGSTLYNLHSIKAFGSNMYSKDILPMRKLNITDFVEKSIKVHGNRYDYSKSKYINNCTKVEIICPIHGNFWQIPNLHTNKRQGCSKCGYNKLRLTLEDFIQKASKIHNNKYNYSGVKYKNSEIKVDILCPKHGAFSQSPHVHLSGHGCSKCKNDIIKETQQKTIVDFLILAEQIHGNLYDYSQVNYENCEKKVNIICKKHGIFLQTPSSHINHKQGCPKCNISKGENKIIQWLINNKIDYIHQASFNECKNPKTNCKLRFDFYIPSKNLLVEYDGEQHFKMGAQLGKYIFTEKDLEGVKHRDIIKTDFAIQSGKKLLRINYNENILNILNKELL